MGISVCSLGNQFSSDHILWSFYLFFSRWVFWGATVWWGCNCLSNRVNFSTFYCVPCSYWLIILFNIWLINWFFQIMQLSVQTNAISLLFEWLVFQFLQVYLYSGEVLVSYNMMHSFLSFFFFSFFVKSGLWEFGFFFVLHSICI